MSLFAEKFHSAKSSTTFDDIRAIELVTVDHLVLSYFQQPEVFEEIKQDISDEILDEYGY
ncbi:hypothetical protein B1C78_00665 [Thioalkalivibrio denitrificans]|uniref:Uncharacterized protein n=1 Tax=Thioalkalivibrio denitrificans TaxID=108003 RepID=A0A1V3NUN5_9GAMM|nr:hypothetical protein B1C78_00665 [Thioalkalivibrio denitrificans]